MKFTEEYEQIIDEGAAAYMFSITDMQNVMHAVRSVKEKELQKAVDIPGEIVGINNDPKLIRFTAGVGPTMVGYIDVFYRELDKEEDSVKVAVHVNLKNSKIEDIKLMGVIRK